MTSMMRSEPMSFYDIYIQPETAFDILSELGETGRVQIVDMNPDVQLFQRNFISELCRCAEMERKLNYIHSEMIKDDVYITDLLTEPKALQPSEMLAFENVLEKWESDLTEISSNQVKLLKDYLELSEMYYVLTQIGPVLGDAELRRDSIFGGKRSHATAAGGDIGPGGRLGIFTGVLRRNRCFSFEKMLWRISRGNIYFQQAEEDKILVDPFTGKDIRKVAFLAIHQGEELSVRVQKICSGFHVNLYPCPKSYEERLDMLDKLERRIDDLNQVLKNTQLHRCKALRTISKQWNIWSVKVKKAKAIYFEMNKFSMDITRRCLISQCWVPTSDKKWLKNTLFQVSENIGTNVPSFVLRNYTTIMSPTFHETNKFTQGFQALIDAYGDSVYRELNPGLFTIITFPFLFAVMFGDFGHGLIILSLSVWMCIYEKKFLAQRSTNEIWNIIFGGRYVILLMGLFTLFTGFVYNDYFSKSFNFHKSQWISNLHLDEIKQDPIIQLDYQRDMTTARYYLGFDPVWSLASKNKILFHNSMKMKMSIILGITHMMFGLWLSLFNHIYFRHKYAILLEFLPEFLFLTCLFIWLVILIYWKWFKYTGTTSLDKLKPPCAPMILILFIDMMLLNESKPPADNCDAYMFPFQKSIQTVLLVVALLCIPILLLGSPLYIHFNHKRKKRPPPQTKAYSKYRKIHKITGKMLHQEHVTKPLGEMMINQAVHTIEFVLSTISHTASYLRLWALSLAHTQLSDMLWEMILSKLALKHHNIFGAIRLFFMFALWAVFTVTILVLMEGLSAFLHTLRLHWVEFMSKFFLGSGTPFIPFSFRKIIYGDTKEKIVCGKSKRDEVE